MVTANVIDVTPTLASIWLKRNKNNRTVSHWRVKQYADDMLNGKWELNAECIVFDENGDLKDGQHRLLAVVQSGATIPMLVACGVETNVSLFDRGRSRSAVDILRFKGYSKTEINTSTLGCAKLDRLLKEGVEMSSDGWCEEWIEKHLDAVRFVARICTTMHAYQGRVSTKFSPLMLAIIYAYESGVNQNELESFVTAVKDGIITSDSQTSAVVFRNDLLAKRVSKNGGARMVWVMMAEKAIYDYVNHIPRRKSYISTKEHVYMKGE